MRQAEGDRYPGQALGAERPSKQRESMSKDEETRDVERTAPGTLLEWDPAPPETARVRSSDPDGHGIVLSPGCG